MKLTSAHQISHIQIMSYVKSRAISFSENFLDYLVSCDWFLIEIKRALIFQFWRRAVSAHTSFIKWYRFWLQATRIDELTGMNYFVLSGLQSIQAEILNNTDLSCETIDAKEALSWILTNDLIDQCILWREKALIM